MSGDVSCEYAVGQYGIAGDNSTLMHNGKTWAAGTRRCIIVRSGHGSDGTGVGPLNNPGFFEVTRALVDAGYTVYNVNAAGASWWGPAGITAMAAAVSYLQTRFGITKFALFGGSMGGGVVIQSLKTLAANCLGVATISAACDLDYFHGSGVSGYVPGYSFPSSGSYFGAFQAETEGVGCYNCTHANWDTASAGHKMWNEYSSWHGLGIPIRLWHGDSDGLVPIGQAQAFVAGVNDPNVTLRTLVGAGHTPWAPGAIGGFGPELGEYTKFFNSLAWPV